MHFYCTASCEPPSKPRVTQELVETIWDQSFKDYWIQWNTAIEHTLEICVICITKRIFMGQVHTDSFTFWFLVLHLVFVRIHL